jgi:hypothetical protein
MDRSGRFARHLHEGRFEAAIEQCELAAVLDPQDGKMLDLQCPLGMEVNVGKPSERPAGRSRQSGAGWRPRGFRFYWP